MASPLQDGACLAALWAAISIPPTRVPPMRFRLTLAAAGLLMPLLAPAHAESVVRYGISMADIPLTTGQPDRGAGAYQFTAYTIYDPLVAWEMDVSDRPR